MLNFLQKLARKLFKHNYHFVKFLRIAQVKALVLYLQLYSAIILIVPHTPLLRDKLISYNNKQERSCNISKASHRSSYNNLFYATREASLGSDYPTVRTLCCFFFSVTVSTWQTVGDFAPLID